MSNPVTKLPDQSRPVATVQDPSPLLVPQMFDAMMRLAEAMSRAKTVPEHLRGSPGDCLRVVEIAHRCGQSPFALADHVYFTSGRMAMDGQGMAGLINASPKIEGSLSYRYEGDRRDPKSFRVIVSGRLRGETKVREVPATMAQGLADSKGARARWQTDPEQMLAYYGARRWARRHAPEVTMGLYTPDELRAAAEGGTIIDAMPEEPLLKNEEASEFQQPAHGVEEVPEPAMEELPDLDPLKLLGIQSTREALEALGIGLESALQLEGKDRAASLLWCYKDHFASKGNGAKKTIASYEDWIAGWPNLEAGQGGK